MNCYRSISVVLFIALTFSSQAKAYDDCNDQPGMSDIYFCFSEKLQASDVRIEKLYRQMMNSMPSEYKKRFKKSQNTWRAYRDAQCTFVFAADDSRREIPCRLQMNEEREKFLIEEMGENCGGCIPYNK